MRSNSVHVTPSGTMRSMRSDTTTGNKTNKTEYPKTQQLAILNSTAAMLYQLQRQQQLSSRRNTVSVVSAAEPCRFAWLHQYTKLLRSLFAAVTRGRSLRSRMTAFSPLGPHPNCSPIIIFFRQGDPRDRSITTTVVVNSMVLLVLSWVMPLHVQR